MINRSTIAGFIGSATKAIDRAIAPAILILLGCVVLTAIALVAYLGANR